MHRTCKCGRIFEWSRLGDFAKSVMDKILVLRGKEPVQVLCPSCRHNEQLGLFKENG
jgi:hypothetical protein